MKGYAHLLFKSLAFVLLALTGLAGCKEMDDTYRQFIGDGETVYVAKPDSVELRGGRNRLEISWLLLSDPKIARYKIYWNNKADSVEEAVTRTSEVDTIKRTLTDLDEGTYFFEIYHFDRNNNSSVATTAIGKVYGDLYQASLLPRAYKDVRRIGEDIEIEWVPADSRLLGVEITYTDAEGRTIEHFVPGSKTLDTLAGFPVGGSLTHRTAFLPDTTALDRFYTDVEEIIIPL